MEYYWWWDAPQIVSGWGWSNVSPERVDVDDSKARARACYTPRAQARTIGFMLPEGKGGGDTDV